MYKINNNKEVESHIVLGYDCNQQCRHCVVQEKRISIKNSSNRNLSMDEAIDSVDSAIRSGATKIVFTGGEPTLRDDLSELVTFCISNNCMVQIQTNGSLLDKINMICSKNIESINMLEFMIPLHSAKAKIHNNVCRSDNGFEKTIQSLKYLTSIGATILGKIVLTKFTVDLNEICKLYERFNVKNITIAYPHCVSFPINKIREVDLKKEDTLLVFERLYREQYRIPIILQAFPRCFVGEYSNIVIQEEQEEFLKLEIIEHKLRNLDGLQWHRFRKLDKRKFIHCTLCNYNNICEGIWKDYLKAYGD